MRARLRRLERAAKQDGVLIRQRDGSVRAFDVMRVRAEMFLASVDLFRSDFVTSEVLEAVRNATPESRAEFEERFGSITFSSAVVAGGYQGGWVEAYELREDGTVEKTFHEGGSEEAERIRRETRERAGR